MVAALQTLTQQVPGTNYNHTGSSLLLLVDNVEAVAQTSGGGSKLWQLLSMVRSSRLEDWVAAQAATNPGGVLGVRVACPLLIMVGF